MELEEDKCVNMPSKSKTFVKGGKASHEATTSGSGLFSKVHLKLMRHYQSDRSHRYNPKKARTESPLCHTSSLRGFSPQRCVICVGRWSWSFLHWIQPGLIKDIRDPPPPLCFSETLGSNLWLLVISVSISSNPDSALEPAAERFPWKARIRFFFLEKWHQ